MGGRGASSGAKQSTGGSAVFQEWLKGEVFKAQLKKGSVTLNIDNGNQPKHLNTPQWKNQVKQAIATIKETGRGAPKSILSRELDPHELVMKYSGTGNLKFRTGAKYPEEYVKLPFTVGRTYDKKLGRYVPSNTLQIKYSDRGTHVFPTKEMK